MKVSKRQNISADKIGLHFRGTNNDFCTFNFNMLEISPLIYTAAFRLGQLQLRSLQAYDFNWFENLSRWTTQKLFICSNIPTSNFTC